MATAEDEGEHQCDCGDPLPSRLDGKRPRLLIAPASARKAHFRHNDNAAVRRSVRAQNRGMGFRLILAFLLLPGIARAGDEGAWPVATRSVSLSLMAGQSFSPSPDGFSETFVPNLEISWPVASRLELGAELHPVFWVNQPRTPDGADRRTALAFAGDAILRWFPVRTGGGLAPYTELALGLCGATDRIPPSGTQLNFLVQAGVGMAVKTGKSWSTVVGWRWFHISNANFGEHNPGVNFSILLVGGRLSIP